MELKRNKDGSFFSSYDGSKKDLQKLLQHLKDIARVGVGDTGFVLEYQGLLYTFNTARELFYFAEGVSAMMVSPYLLKMEEHVKNIVSQVFKLDDTEFLSPDEFSDPE
jgi:hypothetical protein